MHPIYLIYLYGAFLLSYLFSSLRLLLFAKKFGLKKVSFKRWFQIFVLARFLNKFLPQGGNVYRAMVLKKEYHFSYKKYTQSFLGFTWIDFLVNLIWIWIFTFCTSLDLSFYGLSPTVFVSIIFFVFLFTPGILYHFMKNLPIKHPLFQKLKESYMLAIHAVTDLKFLFKAFLYSSLSFITFLLMLALCFASIQAKLDLFQVAVFATILKLGSFIIITPGNLGITELACGYLGEISSISFGVGILAASILRAVSYLVVITLGPSFGGIPLLKEIRNKMFHD